MQISSTPAEVKDGPLLLGAGQGWAPTAGNHMTETVDTIREATLRSARTGSQLGQIVFGVFPSPGDRWVSGILSGEHQSFYSPDIWPMWERIQAVSTEQKVLDLPAHSEMGYIVSYLFSV